MADLRKFTLDARKKLTTEASELLLQIYGLEPDGRFVPTAQRSALSRLAGAIDTRNRLEKLFADELEAGLTLVEAHTKLVKEVAFTHLNRLVALKLLEARRIIRGAIDRHHDSNGFKIYLASHDSDLKLFEQGSMPQDDLGEGPSDRAYRNFLLWQYAELAKEVKVLFDPDNLPSRLFPRPRVLREIIDSMNTEEFSDAWAPDNEETIGWVYQFFIAEEKDAAFDRVFKHKEKFQKADIPAASQVFTPRWIVRFLVHNSLGRLWLSMHPDSGLAGKFESLVPLPEEPQKPALKPAKEIRVLDPATGTMHFGLVAFDLLVQMYREELANAGREHWPEKPSVDKEEDIPAAIIANNLFGIDIDLRAVQLASLALYMRAKSTFKNVVLTESNLACADVTIFRGHHLATIAKEMGLPPGITRELLQKFCESVNDAGMMGSLVRLEDHFQNLGAESLRRVIDDFVIAKAKQGIDESYFGSETSKGLRLLDVLARRYDVVFTNPPYMSNRNMNADMSSFMKRHYKKSKGDLYGAFIERCTELLSDTGRLAMITQQSFMFISSFEDLRLALSNATAIEAIAHTGARAFPEVQGEKVNTTAFVLRRENFQVARDNSIGIYFRLVNEPDAEAKRRAFEESLARSRNGEPDPRVFFYLQGDFPAMPSRPWVYWITPGLRALFSKFPPLKSFAEPRQGLATTDNPRFLRNWWEVGLARVSRSCSSLLDAKASGRKWFPYMKGGSFLRWYGNQEQVLNFLDDGRELKAWVEQHTGESWSKRVTSTDVYFKIGITWSKVASGPFSVRLNPGGFIFDVGGCCAFPENISVEELLGILNSACLTGLLKFLSPTVNNEVGQIASLPLSPSGNSDLSVLVHEAVSLARCESRADERTYDFTAPAQWLSGREISYLRRQRLAEIENAISDQVYRLYDVSAEDRSAIEAELAEPSRFGDSEGDGTESEGSGDQESDDKLSLTSQRLAAQWVSYAVGIALGRFIPGKEGSIGIGDLLPEVAAKVQHLVEKTGLMVLEDGHPSDLASRVIEILGTIHGDAEAVTIIRTVAPVQGSARQAMEDYLVWSFFKEHVKRYQKRPVYWLLQSPGRHYSAYLFHEHATDQTLALLQGKRYLGGRIHRFEGELSEAKKLEGATGGGAKSASKKKSRDLAEELEDLKAFDRHITNVNNFPVLDATGIQNTVGWQPEFDDGVLLNAAPLHELAPSWKKADNGLDLKKAWKELEKGEYDWAKTAMRYWPQRVLASCRDNKSFAIAHGLV
jgi:hypothetical protein